MKQFLVRFFISLCIFLITGYGQVYAQIYQSLQQTASPAITRVTQHNNPGTEISVSAENPAGHFNIPLFEKTEDSDLSLFKKLIKDVPGFSLLVSVRALPFLYSTGKSTLACRTAFSLPPLDRCLFMQVFRI